MDNSKMAASDQLWMQRLQAKLQAELAKHACKDMVEGIGVAIGDLRSVAEFMDKPDEEIEGCSPRDGLWAVITLLESLRIDYAEI